MATLTIGWLDGQLVSASALHQALVECTLGPHEDLIARTVRRCRVVHRRASLRLGPASGPVAVWRLLAAPLASLLAWQVRSVDGLVVGGVTSQVITLEGRTGRTAILVALPWGLLPGPISRAACRLGLESGVRWVMVTNGQAWRWLDVLRPLGRQHVGLLLPQALADERVWEAFWLIGHADTDRLDGLERLTKTLETGATRAVREAVGDVRSRLTRHLGATDDEVLTHVFRWLFLLFAEARDLLPMHNPVYRRAYALSTLAQHARRGLTPFNLWDALRASARLAHTGSRHPLLEITALNSALFEPEATPRSERRQLPDAVVAPMLDALTTVVRQGRRVPVSFGDLGVEHLGTIYEDVLAGRGRAANDEAPTPLVPPGLVRKQTGTFYTPRNLADHLVSETLGPIVSGRSADEVLALRVVDPAAGSGAILASAARYLMAAVEACWVREGRGGPLDVSPAERADAVRRIVEQCLYGVDIHGRAVQVARLSLWLLSMTRERPLTFLDHHLRVGNSLIGTTPADIVARRPGQTRGEVQRDLQPGLFDLTEWDRRAGDLALAFAAMSAAASDSAAAVHAKTRQYRALRDDAVLCRWRRRADLWCGAWMHDAAIADGLWNDLDRLAQRRATTLPSHRLTTLAHTLETHARETHCFHWPLEFPEVFHARGPSGFDAVVANPPWETLRADLGPAAIRVTTRADVTRQQRFILRSGAYSRGTTGHRNLYQLFVERMLQLCRAGGRVGVIAPWGLLADHASAATREKLFSMTATERVSVFDNRKGIFPIHRSVRFVALTATMGGTTRGVTLRTARLQVGRASESEAKEQDLWLHAPLLQAADPDGLAVPCLRSEHEVHVLETLVAQAPRLRDAPWSLTFGRELNASDDRSLLLDAHEAPEALPVVAGRDLRPFAVVTSACRTRVREADVERRLPSVRWRRWRLGYRDVASATNRLSLIAALVPPRVLTTHTVFVLRQPLGLRAQFYLCGVLNSLVANWFVRLYMGTHVTSALLGRLPVPAPAVAPGQARRVARLAARLRRCAEPELMASQDYADLQVVVASLYGLSSRQLATIVGSFPALPDILRTRILDGFDAYLASDQHQLKAR